jgi:hypothetical protein
MKPKQASNTLLKWNILKHDNIILKDFTKRKIIYSKLLCTTDHMSGLANFSEVDKK